MAEHSVYCAGYLHDLPGITTGARGYLSSRCRKPLAATSKEETMSNYLTVDEVNRLVGNRFAGGSGVFCPAVGSPLCSERAVPGDFQTHSPSSLPRSILSSQQQGVSLVDELGAVSPPATRRCAVMFTTVGFWPREGDVLTMEGVGVLKSGDFYACTCFRPAAEPAGHEPVRIASPVNSRLGIVDRRWWRS